MRLRLTLPTLLFAATVSCHSTDSPEASSQDAEPGLESLALEPKVADDPMVEDVTVGIADPVEAAAPRSGPSQGGQLEEELARIELRQQKQRALAKDYVEKGNNELETTDLTAALASFASAVELDPANAEAREGLRRVQALLGDGYQAAADTLADETERALVRRAQARLSVDEMTSRGDNALRQGRYSDAIAAYRQAETILRWNPMIATDSLDERVVRARIDEAIRLREENASREAQEARAAAELEKLAAENAERQRREDKLREYYEFANEAFVSDNFRQAETWCNLILIEDPGNEAARSLLDTAREARHNKTDEKNREHYREQWLRTFDELDTLDVPQTDPLVFKLSRWREVRERTPLTHGDLQSAGSEERQEVLAKLDSVRFSPSFGGPDGDGSPLEEVASFLQALTGVNFWISNAVRDDLDEEETSIVMQLPDRSVRKVLDLIAETSTSLRWKVEDGVVKFVTAEEMTGGQQLVTYSVQDLITPIQDYPGREINISPSGGLIPPDEDITERDTNVIGPSVLEDLIRNNVSPASWDADPANSIRITEMGQLVINQTPDVHRDVQRLLDDLREATGIMVDIQARFMTVEDNFLEDIGVDFRGLGQPGLGSNGNDFNDFGDASTQQTLGREIGRSADVGAFYDDGGDGNMRARVEELYDETLGNDAVMRNSGGLSFQWTYLNDLELELILRAVSKSERVQLVTAPRILVHNTARANLSVMNQVAYVQDFDVEIAQAASIADPIVAVIQDGVVLDVRPVVSADRRFITMEMRPTVAQLTRPIEEKVTTLGSQNSVTIQLPRVEIQRVRTTIPLPDGGTVLLGGQKISEKQDKASGVPIVNKIPILSALFERKGNFTSNRKLLILLRANVVIPEEKEPSAAELGLAEE